MKAEERHELRENDLASWLQFGLWAFLKQNGSYFLLVLALGFLGFQLWNLYQRRQEVARQQAWAQLREADAAADPVKALEDLVNSDVMIPVKAQAALELGQRYGRFAAFPEVLRSMGMSRAETLSKAYENYTKALALQGDDPLIAAKAHLGMAGIYEDQGAEWDKAKAEYELMTKDKLFAGTAFVDFAKERLATLEDRRNAPRLAAAIPLPPETRPQTGLPGSSSLLQGLPGLPGGGLGATTQSQFPGLMLGSGAATSSAPAPVRPVLPAGPLLPFSGPPIPGISPATPATAPAGTAPASQP